jgi:S-formylglutathione hydrolase
MRLVFLALLCVSTFANASELVKGTFETALVPSPLNYTVLLPDGYGESTATYPLLYCLHGGAGDNGYLTNMRPAIDELWKAGTLPKMVIVTPSATRVFYMDTKDGAEKWDTLLAGPFLEHLRKTYRVSHERGGTLLFGVSMGGMGGLRLAFKHPDVFGAVAALEPGIDPVLRYKDLQPRHTFWRAPELMQEVFGTPVDAAYWEANNPASIANANADKLRAAALGIYIDVGDEDAFGLDEAAEFMHRILRDHHIRHEYRLLHGADHVGRTLPGRSQDGLRFLARYLNPPPPDPQAEALHRQLAPLKPK